MRTSTSPGGAHGTLPGTIGRIIQAFKSITTNSYIHGVRELGWSPFAGRLWQRDYWEHIIRNDRELWAIQEYIVNNPAQWASDRDNLAR
jgi:REP element-mobilizing transposase RayT